MTPDKCDMAFQDGVDAFLAGLDWVMAEVGVFRSEWIAGWHFAKKNVELLKPISLLD